MTSTSCRCEGESEGVGREMIGTETADHIVFDLRVATSCLWSSKIKKRR